MWFSSILVNRVQLSSDKLGQYVYAIEAGFGYEVYYATIVKFYEADRVGPGRYSLPKVTSTEKRVVKWNPDVSKISTSYVEGQNLTLRMSMRRFTRLTNAFSKKVDNLRAAVVLHFAHYNFVRIHQTIKTTPATEAGVDNRVWTIKDLIQLAN